MTCIEEERVSISLCPQTVYETVSAWTIIKHTRVGIKRFLAITIESHEWKPQPPNAMYCGQLVPVCCFGVWNSREEASFNCDPIKCDPPLLLYHYLFSISYSSGYQVGFMGWVALLSISSKPSFPSFKIFRTSWQIEVRFLPWPCDGLECCSSCSSGEF